MIEISSLFQFNSFVNNDHYLVSLFTPICMFSQKPWRQYKEEFTTATMPGTQFLIYEDGGERPPLLSYSFHQLPGSGSKG